MGNVLIAVSDHQFLGELSDCCKKEGFTPHGLTHGSYVIPWIGERKPEFIIIDTRLEGGVLKFYSEVMTTFSGPVFIITEGDKEAGQFKNEGLDVSACFNKSLKPAEVISKIKTFLVAV